jgi:uncharacterized membrane protein
MPAQRVVAYLRNSLWFVPGLWVVGAGILAFGLISLDSATPSFATHVPLLFGGGADGARSVLSSIAGSAITVAGVTFSITIVALQLASSQFSPSVLRNFMRDRISQMVLGSFIGTFFYSLLVLRSIRSKAADAEAFVPSISVSVGILFAVVAVVMLVLFIHHISTRIQVSTIVGTIADETAARIRADWRDRDGDDLDMRDGPDGEPRGIASVTSGYLQLVDSGGLVSIAKQLDLVIRVDKRTGEWVQEGAVLFSVWPASIKADKLAPRLTRRVTLGSQRSLEQDAAFGIRQLVDVAVKALSPGINDPTTAIDCIHRLTQLLVDLGVRREPQHEFADDGEQVRLIVRTRSYRELVDLAFDQVRQYAARTPAVVDACAAAIETVIAVVPPDRGEALRRQAALFLERTDEIEPSADRDEVVARLARILAA